MAAMDTVSSTIGRILWILAKHSSDQLRLRNELADAQRTYGAFKYDNLTSLPFLDAIYRETLRL